jgi:hypothetical protein
MYVYDERDHTCLSSYNHSEFFYSIRIKSFGISGEPLNPLVYLVHDR